MDHHSFGIKIKIFIPVGLSPGLLQSTTIDTRLHPKNTLSYYYYVYQVDSMMIQTNDTDFAKQTFVIITAFSYIATESEFHAF